MISCNKAEEYFNKCTTLLFDLTFRNYAPKMNNLIIRPLKHVWTSINDNTLAALCDNDHDESILRFVGPSF